KNLTIAQARAMVIRQYLAKKFRVDDARIKTQGLGEEAQGEASAGGRVEIIVYPDGSPSQVAKNKKKWELQRMNSDSGHHISIWMATSEMPSEPALSEDTHADVCVVGAGIAGMTTAYRLAREGKSVVVLDDGRIGGGMTERTTAHLVNALDDRFFELE